MTYTYKLFSLKDIYDTNASEQFNSLPVPYAIRTGFYAPHVKGFLLTQHQEKNKNDLPSDSMKSSNRSALSLLSENSMKQPIKSDGLFFI